MRHIVLDTNCLIQSISKHSPYYPVWDAYVHGKYILCVTTDILYEYFEILSRLATTEVAQTVLDIISTSRNTLLCNPFFKFNLIESDPDDNKFVDCAIVGQAEYIVSNDHHFSCLKAIPFPKVDVISIDDFLLTV